MSHMQGFWSTVDMPLIQPPTIDRRSSSTASQPYTAASSNYRRCTEEIRQQQVYEAFKEDVIESIEHDPIMEDEFFGRRRLSTCDLVEDPNKVRPKLSPIQAAHPDNHHYLTTSATRSHTIGSRYTSLADEPQTSNVTDTRDPCYNKRCCCSKGCPPPIESRDGPRSPPLGIDGLVFLHHVSDEEVRQARLRRDHVEEQEHDTSSPISENDSDDDSYIPLDAFLIPLSFQTPREHSPRTREFLRLADLGARPWEPESRSLSARLDKVIPSRFDAERSSIRKIGSVDSTTVVHDNSCERARVTSQYAEVSTMLTPEFNHDNETGDGVRVEQEEQEDSDYNSWSRPPINSHTIKQEQPDHAVANSPNTAHGHSNSHQVADYKDRGIDYDFFHSLAAPAYRPAMSRESIVVSQEKSTELESPRIKLESSDDINTHFNNRALIADPAVYPGDDLPEIDIAALVRAHLDQHKNKQAVQNLGEPQDFSHFSLAQPKDSSMIKRRTKQQRNSKTRSSQQILPYDTYGQTPRTDIASFFRVNARPLSTNIKTTPPVRISKRPSYSDAPRVKKRSARESFDRVEIARENSAREASLKRPRERESFDLVELCHENNEREYARKRARLDVTPTTPEFARLPSTPGSNVSSSFDGSPMATALKGYPGQFELPYPNGFAYRHVKIPKRKHVFGNHLHANGEIINMNYRPASTQNATTDLADATDFAALQTMHSNLAHADLHHSYAEQILRTHEEEELRREAYRECAAARLEGVPVGYYRYFAGHMTVEEYNEARMCVCWSGCSCVKMCTGFGDLACPCAGDLVVGEEM